MTNPTDTHYGIWGWFLEEPPAQMNPADWNWADFIGSRLAQALAVHDRLLRSATREGARTALRHASLAVFRRNVQPDYTNIAVMGAVVTAAAGEILQLPFLLDYARRRLANVLKLANELGGFSEYNSPTYTRVALEECERALHLIQDPVLRQAAEELRQIAWKVLAEHFHPGTGQLAGPNSRAYSDWIQPKLARYLAEQTGAPIRPRMAGHSEAPFVGTDYDLVPPLPCPPQFALRFAQLPADPHEIRQRLGRDVEGTTWFTQDACLGSATRDIGWVQRRGLLAYWRAPEDPAVALRARMLKDGRDFASSNLWQIQRGPRVLSAWAIAYGAGDFHPTLGAPADSTFMARDLRLRIMLEGRGVQVRQLDANRYALSAGAWKAVISTADSFFDGVPLTWAVGSDSESCWLDAVLHQGQARSLDCRSAQLELAYTLELVRTDDQPLPHPIRRSNTDENQRHWTWNDLAVLTPIAPQRRH